jgi:hypothetical protein
MHSLHVHQYHVVKQKDTREKKQDKEMGSHPGSTRSNTFCKTERNYSHGKNIAPIEFCLCDYDVLIEINHWDLHKQTPDTSHCPKKPWTRLRNNHYW